MWMKLFAIVSLGAVLVLGGALVSKAKKPVTGPSGLAASSASFDPSPIATISNGEEVNLADHIDPNGGYTLFEFGADW